MTRRIAAIHRDPHPNRIGCNRFAMPHADCRIGHVNVRRFLINRSQKVMPTSQLPLKIGIISRVSRGKVRKHSFKNKSWLVNQCQSLL